MPELKAALRHARGGAFLLEARTPGEIFTPEDFTDEHRAIARTTDQFWAQEVAPHLEAIQHQEPGVAIRVLRKSAELGLTAVIVPERFGGMEMDLISAMIVAEGVARDGSYAAWHGTQAGIGILPLLLFGTDDQKNKYLPKLARAEWIGAYCLSEPQAGSDALAAKTRADLSSDGKHYILNGQKMWITNGGAADFYTIFAKVGGEKFTAFLVERSWQGVHPGAEEKKMGLKGSSTTAVYLDNVHVPVDNVLGEVGRGHIIAFNILNLGRLKLGPFGVGGAKNVLAACLRYAGERKAFGKSIGEFGMIRQKLGEMAIRIYAAESMSYRVAGAIEGLLGDFSWQQEGAAELMLKSVEEFATECSFVKVFGSEMLDYVVDEGVQIHGGYGYHQDYLVERAYRDSRINRIFEGTNEINRLLATGMLLKRAQRGKLPLVDAVKRLQAELLAPPPNGDATEDEHLVASAKKICLLLLGVAYQRYQDTLEGQQEILAGIADAAMNAYAMESVYLRARKSGTSQAATISSVFLRDAATTIESAARNVIAACSTGDAMRIHLAALKRFARFEPVNAFEARNQIARRLLEVGRYVS